MTHAPVAAGPAKAGWRWMGESTFAAWNLLAAFVFAATTFCAVVNFAWRQPMFDQWREYETYLSLPFPQNVIQLDNGHRPALPILVRIAEIRWFAADQLLQITIGTLCAFACAWLLAACAWRERSLSFGRRSFGVLVGVLGILWLGNARRLLHGSEALHGYLPTLFALGAVLLIARTRNGRPAPAIASASILCVLATFSFGLGIAAFGAVLLLLVLLRRPMRELFAPSLAMLVSFVLYTYVLPGSEGVRGQIEVAPVDTVVVLAQWLASPWKSAWLDLATGPEPEPNLATWTYPALSDSARLVAGHIGIDTACLIAGLLGIALFGAAALNLYRHSERATRLEVIAVGAGTYAFVSGVLTVLARLSILHQLPDQIYADRYLLWPSLFWCSITLLVTAQLPQLRGRFALAAAVPALALPLVLLVSQNGAAIWGSLVYRSAQQNAAFLRSGVFDAEHFSGERIGLEANLQEVALLRGHRLAMFADGAWRRVGTPWTGSLEQDSAVDVQAHWTGTVDDATAIVPAGHLEGMIRQGLGRLHHRRQLMILTPDHIIVGLAEYSEFAPFIRPLQLRFPPKRGFDGYVRAFDPRQHYLLAAADFATNRAIMLTRIPPLSDATVPQVDANASPDQDER